jgi:hypothetical protein
MGVDVGELPRVAYTRTNYIHVCARARANAMPQEYIYSI